jgi:ferredoxin--NADP+ reductase
MSRERSMHGDVTDQPRHPSIAVVGSGPSGCYSAQFLRKRWPTSEIVIIDRLTTPYGLARYGVAPDHLGTRAITRQFDRLFDRGEVRFIGGTEIGNEVTLEDLHSAFDIVVLATGLHGDKALNSVPAIDGVYGAGRVTRLINGHPDEVPEGFAIGRRSVIVGNGNVAIDLVRLFLHSESELISLGVAAEVAQAISRGPVAEIHVVGRSASQDAKFDPAMIHDLAKSTDVSFSCEPPMDPDEAETPVARAIVELVRNSPAHATRSVAFHFRTEIEQVIGERTVTGVILRRNDGSESRTTIDADSICTAIGFEDAPHAKVRRAELESSDSNIERGLLSSGVYCVGWLRRGPRGTIPDNRADARLVTDEIIRSVEDGVTPTGKPGLAGIPSLANKASLLSP